MTFLCQNWLFSNRKFCSFILRLLKTFWYGRFSLPFLFKVAISVVRFSNLWFSDSFASKYCHWNGRKVCWLQTEIFWRKKILLLQSCKIFCTYIPTFFFGFSDFFCVEILLLERKKRVLIPNWKFWRKKSLNPRLLNLPLLPDIATSKWNGREKRPYQIDILKKLLYPKLTKLCSDCTLVLFKPCFPCCSAAVSIRTKNKNIKFIGATFFCD